MYRAIVFRYIAEFIIYFAITIPRKSMKKINDLDIHTYILDIHICMLFE